MNPYTWSPGGAKKVTWWEAFLLRLVTTHRPKPCRQAFSCFGVMAGAATTGDGSKQLRHCSNTDQIDTDAATSGDQSRRVAGSEARCSAGRPQSVGGPSSVLATCERLPRQLSKNPEMRHSAGWRPVERALWTFSGGLGRPRSLQTGPPQMWYPSVCLMVSSRASRFTAIFLPTHS